MASDSRRRLVRRRLVGDALGQRRGAAPRRIEVVVRGRSQDTLDGDNPYSYLSHIRGAEGVAEEMRRGAPTDPFGGGEPLFGGGAGSIPIRSMYVTSDRAPGGRGEGGDERTGERGGGGGGDDDGGSFQGSDSFEAETTRGRKRRGNARPAVWRDTEED